MPSWSELRRMRKRLEDLRLRLDPDAAPKLDLIISFVGRDGQPTRQIPASELCSGRRQRKRLPDGEGNDEGRQGPAGAGKDAPTGNDA